MNPKSTASVTSILITVAIVALTIVATSCRTSEANYARAYDIAMQRQVDRAGGQSAYDAMLSEANTRVITSSGDTLPYRNEAVTIVSEIADSATSLKPYAIVAGQFRQLFHAKSMMHRLRQQGWPEATIVANKVPIYYVVAASADHIDQITDQMKELTDKPPFTLMKPCPWVLHNISNIR